MTQHDVQMVSQNDRRDRAALIVSLLVRVGDEAQYLAAPPALSATMAENELQALAMACLRALPIEAADQAVDAAFRPHEPPSLCGDVDGLDLVKAKAEVARMGPRGVKAMARACVEQMPVKTREAFCDWLGKKLGRA